MARCCSFKYLSHFYSSSFSVMARAFGNCISRAKHHPIFIWKSRKWITRLKQKIKINWNHVFSMKSKQTRELKKGTWHSKAYEKKPSDTCGWWKNSNKNAYIDRIYKSDVCLWIVEFPITSWLLSIMDTCSALARAPCRTHQCKQIIITIIHIGSESIEWIVWLLFCKFQYCFNHL